MKNKILTCVLALCLANMSEAKMNIFFAFDNNFAKYTAVTIASILSNSDDDDEFCFYVIDDNISEKNKKKIEKLKKIKNFSIEYISMNSDVIKSLPLVDGQKERFGGHATYYRYLVPFVKKDVDKALYLDGDLIVFKSLKKLWNTDLGDNLVAAVGTIGIQKPYIDKLFSVDGNSPEEKKYFNAGVLLMNCKKFRDDNLFEVLIKETDRLHKEINFRFPDQDTLNYICRGKAIILPMRYNMTPSIAILPYFQECMVNYEKVDKLISYYEQSSFLKDSTLYLDVGNKVMSYIYELKNLTIFHYAVSPKPWHWGYNNIMQKHYFKYLRKTDFYDIKDMLYDCYVHIKEFLAKL